MVEMKNDGPLTQAEIDALLAGSESRPYNEGKGMCNKQIVVTLYGRDKEISHVSVNLFEQVDQFQQSKNPARNYCDNINGLELANDEWIYASIVNEGKKINLLSHSSLRTLTMYMDDRGLQKLLHQVDHQTLVVALSGADSEIMERLSKNMTKRAALILKEDIEYLGPIGKKDIREARQKIIGVYQHLADTGEIIIYRSNEDKEQYVQKDEQDTIK
jgi:hypothetical protein